MMNACRLLAALSLLAVASAFLAPPPSSLPLVHHQTRAVRSSDEGGDSIPSTGYFVSQPRVIMIALPLSFAASACLSFHMSLTFFPSLSGGVVDLPAL